MFVGGGWGVGVENGLNFLSTMKSVISGALGCIDFVNVCAQCGATSSRESVNVSSGCY